MQTTLDINGEPRTKSKNRYHGVKLDQDSYDGDKNQAPEALNASTRRAVVIKGARQLLAEPAEAVRRQTSIHEQSTPTVIVSNSNSPRKQRSDTIPTIRQIAPGSNRQSNTHIAHGITNSLTKKSARKLA